MPRHTLDDVEKQKKPKQNFQSLPPQTEIDINEKDTPEGTDPKWLGGSILTFIVSSVLWIPFILLDEDYLTRITNPEGDMTTLDWLSFLPLMGIMCGMGSTYLTFITSKNPKLVEEWKEWNLKEEMRKHNPNLLSEGEPKDGSWILYRHVMVASILGGLFLIIYGVSFGNDPGITWLGILLSAFGFLMILIVPLLWFIGAMD